MKVIDNVKNGMIGLKEREVTFMNICDRYESLANEGAIDE